MRPEHTCGVFAVMSRNGPFLILVGAILLVLLVLFLAFGYLRHEREEGLTLNAGPDEQSRQIRDELDQYRVANRNTQLGILATGGVVVVVAAVWWVAQRRPESE